MKANKDLNQKTTFIAGLNKYLALSLGVHLLLLALLISPAFLSFLGLQTQTPNPTLLVQRLNVELIDVTMEDVAYNPKELEKISKKTKKSVNPIAKKTFKTALDSKNNKLKIIDEVPSKQAETGTKDGQENGTSLEENRKVLMSYKDYLTNYLNSSKQYPRIAEKLRQEGMVVLELVINKQGLITKLNVKQSSNFKILDTAALNHVKSLSPFKELPSADIENYKVEVPIVYQIN